MSASLVVAAALLVACNSTKGNPNAPTTPTAPTPPPPTASVRDVVVTSSPASATTYQMTAKADLSDGTSSDVTTTSRWDTSDATLATVSASGLLTVLKSGHIYVRATYQNMAGMLDMTINAPPSPPQAATLALSGVASEPPPTPKPVASVTLRIVQGPDTGQSTMTDASGHFMFPPLHPGVIGVEAVKDGYLLWRLTNLMLDHDRDLQVVLYPTPPVNAAGASATARCNDASWSWAQTRADACTANSGIAYTVCPGPLCQSVTTGR